VVGGAGGRAAVAVDLRVGDAVLGHERVVAAEPDQAVRAAAAGDAVRELAADQGVGAGAADEVLDVGEDVVAEAGWAVVAVAVIGLVVDVDDDRAVGR
jgi:hypothetical protein